MQIMKRKLSVLFIFGLLLCSCNQNIAEFKEGFSFENLTNNDPNADFIIERSYANIAQASHIKYVDESYTNDLASNETKYTQNIEIWFYSNPLIHKIKKFKQESTSSGVNASRETETTDVYLIDGGMETDYTLSEGILTKSTTTAPENIENFYRRPVPQINKNFSVYKDKNDYVLVYSSDKKTITYDGAGFEKERITVNRAQYIARVNKNYQMYSYTSIVEVKQNFTKASGEYFKDMKLYSSTKCSMELEYKDRVRNDDVVNQITNSSSIKQIPVCSVFFAEYNSVTDVSPYVYRNYGPQVNYINENEFFVSFTFSNSYSYYSLNLRVYGILSPETMTSLYLYDDYKVSEDYKMKNRGKTTLSVSFTLIREVEGNSEIFSYKDLIIS